MTHGHFQFGFFAVGHLPGWLFPGAGGYLLYRGAGSPNEIDYAAPVGVAQAGAATVLTDAGVSHADGRWSFCLRAVSDAGVEEANTDAITVIVEDGELLGEQPAGVLGGRVTPLAGGFLRVELALSVGDGQATPAQVLLAERPPTGTTADIDWDGPLALWSIKGPLTALRATIGPYADSQTVWLAARTANSLGGRSPVTLLPPAVADAVGPDPVTSVSVETF
jgi:hypothetical protein